jgi:hypothetical protein
MARERTEWEYKTVQWKSFDSLEQQLNEVGRADWEFVTVVDWPDERPNVKMLVLKRHKV